MSFAKRGKHSLIAGFLGRGRLTTCLAAIGVQLVWLTACVWAQSPPLKLEVIARFLRGDKQAITRMRAISRPDLKRQLERLRAQQQTAEDKQGYDFALAYFDFDYKANLEQLLEPYRRWRAGNHSEVDSDELPSFLFRLYERRRDRDLLVVLLRLQGDGAFADAAHEARLSALRRFTLPTLDIVRGDRTAFALLSDALAYQEPMRFAGDVRILRTARKVSGRQGTAERVVKEATRLHKTYHQQPRVGNAKP